MRIGRPRSDNGPLTLVPFNVSERAAITALLGAKSYSQLKIVATDFHNWVWDKGDMLIWTPVLNRIDRILLQYVRKTNLHILPGNHLPPIHAAIADDFVDDFDYANDEDLDRQCVIKILKVLQIIIDSCTAKAMFNSVGIVMLLLDSCDPNICQMALFIIVIAAFVARKGKRASDAPWIAEVLRRLRIMALPPARAVGSDLESINPLLYHAQFDWRARDQFERSYRSANDETEITLSNGDLRRSIEQLGDISGEGLRFEEALVNLSLCFSIREMRELRHRIRVLVNDSLVKRRCLLDNQLLVQMAIISFSPTYFQTEIAQSDWFFNELALLTRSHRELSYFTIALLSDTWLNLMSEKVMVKQVGIHLQLVQPHGLFFELLSTYISDRQLFPYDPAARSKPDPIDGSNLRLPELLNEERDASSEGSTSAAHDQSQQKKHADTRVRRAIPILDDDENAVIPEVLPAITCSSEIESQSFQQSFILDDITLVALSSKDLYMRLSKNQTHNQLSIDAEGKIVDSHAIYSERIRNHADLITALLDLYQELLFSCPTPALCSAQILKTITSLIEVRDYRYLQTCMSALRSIEAYYDNSALLTVTRTNLRDINLVERCARRLRYELAHIHELMQIAKAEKWIEEDDFPITPWTSQGSILASGGEDAAAKLEAAVSKYKGMGSGVPSSWLARNLAGSYFWQFMEEMSNRRALTSAIVKDGPVLQWYPNTQTSISADLIEEFGLAFRYIFTENAEVSSAVVSSAIQSLSDIRSEDPSSQKSLFNSYIMESFYKAVPQLIRYESCMSFIPTLLTCQHRLGVRDLLRHNLAPIHLLIEHSASPLLTYYDRVNHITAAIGEMLEGVVKEGGYSFAEPVALKFESVLIRLRDELKSAAPWRQKTCAIREVKNYLAESAYADILIRVRDDGVRYQDLKGLSLPETPAHQYVIDRIANISRTLQTFLHGCRQTHYPMFAEKCLPILLDIACALPDALPPMAFSACVPTHPIVELIKSLLTYSCETPGSSASTLIENVLLRILIKAADMNRFLNSIDNLKKSLELSSGQRYPTLSADIQSKRETFVHLAHNLGTSLTFITGAIKEKEILLNCYTEAQLSILLGLSSIVPLANQILQDLLHALYSDFVDLDHCKDCPMVLVFRGSIHEPPQLIAAKTDARRDKKNPVTDSACFHLTSADPISTSIGRPCLGQHAFLWSTVCDYAYSTGNALLDSDVPVEAYNAKSYETPKPSYAMCNNSMCDGDVLSSSVPAWQSDSLIKELIRTLCVAIRGFMSACARATSISPEYEPAREIRSIQTLIGVHLGNLAVGLLANVPQWPSPSELVESKAIEIPVIGENIEAYVRKACYLAECWDILYRTHVDEKAASTIIAPPIDVAVKLGFANDARRAILFINNLHCAIQSEVVRRLYPQFKGASLDAGRFSTAWLSHQRQLASQLALVPDEELQTWVPLVEKAYQSTASYSEKITSWRRVSTSNSIRFHVKEKRSTSLKCTAPIDEWFYRCGQFHAFEMLYTCLKMIAMTQYECWHSILIQPECAKTEHLDFHMAVVERFGSSKSLGSILRCLQYIFMPLEESSKEHALAWRTIHGRHVSEESTDVNLEDESLAKYRDLTNEYSARSVQRALSICGRVGVSEVETWLQRHTQKHSQKSIHQWKGAVFGDDETGRALKYWRLDELWFDNDMPFSDLARASLIVSFGQRLLSGPERTQMLKRWLPTDITVGQAADAASDLQLLNSVLTRMNEFPAIVDYEVYENYTDVAKSLLKDYVRGVIICAAQNPTRKQTIADAISRSMEVIQNVRLRSEDTLMDPPLWPDTLQELLDLISNFAVAEETGWLFGLPQTNPEGVFSTKLKINYAPYLALNEDDLLQRQLQSLRDTEARDDEAISVIRAYAQTRVGAKACQFLALGSYYQRLYSASLDANLMIKAAAAKNERVRVKLGHEVFTLKTAFKVLRVALDHRKRLHHFFHQVGANLGFAFLDNECGVGGVPAWTLTPDAFSPIFGVQAPEERLGPYVNNEKLKRRLPTGRHGSAAAMRLPPLQHQAPDWLISTLSILSFWNELGFTATKQSILVMLDTASIMSGMSPADYRALMVHLVSLAQINKLSGLILSHKVTFAENMTNDELLSADDGQINSNFKKVELPWLPRGLGAILRMPKNADSLMCLQNVAQLVKFVAEDPSAIMHSFRKAIERAVEEHGKPLKFSNSAKSSNPSCLDLGLPVEELERVCYSCIQKSQTLFENVVAAVCILRKSDSQDSFSIIQLAPVAQADARFKKLVDNKTATQSWQVVTTLIQHLKFFTSIHAATFKLPLIAQLNTRDRLRVDQAVTKNTLGRRPADTPPVCLNTEYKLPPFLDLEELPDILKAADLESDVPFSEHLSKICSPDYTKKHLLYPYCLTSDCVLFILFHLFHEIPDLHQALSKTPPQHVMADASPGIQRSTSLRRSSSGTVDGAYSIIDVKKLKLPHSINTGTLFRQIIRECAHGLMARALPKYTDNLADVIPPTSINRENRNVIYAPEEMIQTLMPGVAKNLRFLNQEISTILKFTAVLLLVATQNLDIRRKLCCEVLSQVRVLCAAQLKRSKSDPEPNNAEIHNEPNEDALVILSYYVGVLLHGLLNLPVPVAVQPPAEEEIVLGQFSFSSQERATLRPAVSKLISRLNLKRTDTIHVAQVWAWTLTALVTPYSLDCELRIPPENSGTNVLDNKSSERIEEMPEQSAAGHQRDGDDSEGDGDFEDSEEGVEILLADEDSGDYDSSHDESHEAWLGEGDEDYSAEDSFEQRMIEDEMLYMTEMDGDEGDIGVESYSDDQSDVDLLDLGYDEEEEDDERAELPHEETTDTPHTSASLDGLVAAEDDDDFDEERDEIPRLREEEFTRGDDEGLEGEELNTSMDDRGDQSAADLWVDSVEWLPGSAAFGVKTKVLNTGRWWAVETAMKTNPYFDHWTSKVSFGTIVTGAATIINDLWPHPNFPILMSERTWLKKPDRIIIDAFDGNKCFRDLGASERWQSAMPAEHWRPLPQDRVGTDLEKHLLKKCEKNMMRMRPWSEPATNKTSDPAPNNKDGQQSESGDSEGSNAVVASNDQNITKTFTSLSWPDRLQYFRLAREDGEIPTGSSILSSAAFKALAFGLGLSERQLIELLELDESVLACLPDDLQEEALALPLESLRLESLKTMLDKNMAKWIEYKRSSHVENQSAEIADNSPPASERDNQTARHASPSALRILTIVQTAPQSGGGAADGGELAPTSRTPVELIPYDIIQNSSDTTRQGIMDTVLASHVFESNETGGGMPTMDQPRYIAISQLWLTILSRPLRDMVTRAYGQETDTGEAIELLHRLDDLASVMNRLSNLLVNSREGARRIEIARRPTVPIRARETTSDQIRPLIPTGLLSTNPDLRARLVYLEGNAWRLNLPSPQVSAAIVDTIMPNSTSLAGIMRLLYLTQQISRRALHALFHNLCSASLESCIQVVSHFVYLLWQAAPDVWLEEVPRASGANSSWYPLSRMIKNCDDVGMNAYRSTSQMVAARVLEFLQSLLCTCPSAILTAFSTPVTQLKHFDYPKFYTSSSPTVNSHKRRKNEGGSITCVASGEVDASDNQRPSKKTRLEENRSAVVANSEIGASDTGGAIHSVDGLRGVAPPIRIFVNILKSAKFAENGHLATCLTNTLSSILSGGEHQGRQSTSELEQLVDTLTQDDMELIIRSCFHRRCSDVKDSGCDAQKLWRAVQTPQSVFPNLILKNGILTLYNSAKRHEVDQILTDCICEVAKEAVNSLRKLQSTLPEQDGLVPHTLNSFSQLSVETDLALLAKAMTVVCDSTLSDEFPNCAPSPNKLKSAKSIAEAKCDTVRDNDITEVWPKPVEGRGGPIDATAEITTDRPNESAAEIKSIPKDRWQIHRIARLFSGIDLRTGIWRDLDQVLSRIEDRYPELVNRHTVTADIGLAGNEEAESASPAPPAHSTHRQRKTTITQDVLNAPQQLGALPTIVNRLLPLLEAYVFMHVIKVADELEDYYLLPSFFQMNGRDSANSTRVLRWGKKDLFRDESGAPTSAEDYAMNMLRFFEEKLWKIFYAEILDTADPEMNASGPTPSHSELMEFCQRHCIAINALIRQTPTLITTALAPLIYMAPNAIWFDNKRLFFRVKMKYFKEEQMLHNSSAPIRLTVRRSDVFVDTYNALRRHADQLHSKIVVTFKDEPGIDAGGLTREWYTILSHEIFNPNYTLFQQHGCKSEFNYPNPLSYITHNHLDLFYFCGQIIAKAIYDGYYLDAYFCRPFYKIILDRQLNIPHDAESIDPIFYKNLLSLTNLGDQDLKDLDLRFTYDVNEFGINHSHELIPNGRDIVVDKSNLTTYINKLAKFKITFGIEKQIENFLKGFYSLIPKYLIQIFNDKELELIISGLPEIDLNDLKQNCIYTNYSKFDQEIIWLWEILEELDKNALANFIQFVTGTSKIPLGGFANLVGNNGPQKFNITRSYNKNHLPTSHTCFNQLDLPPYQTKQIMRTKLLQAITEGSQGFGFA